MDAETRRQFLTLDLERAWERVSMIDGPELGDAAASLDDRSLALGERIGAFLEEMTGEPRPVARARGSHAAAGVSLVDGLLAEGLCVRVGP